MGYLIKQKCINCGKEYPPDEWIYKGCEACKTENFVSNVVSVYDIDGIAEKVDKKTLEKRKDNTMWKYKEFLPVENEKNIVSLGEGSTPLVKCEKTGEYIGVKNFYVKNESVNPTWSFKDRLCSSVVSKALEMGFKTVTISTSGN
ncbi:threonine synthase, partial [Thermococci archaeon]